MSAPDEQGPSFDPRTWVSPAGEKTATQLGLEPKSTPAGKPKGRPEKPSRPAEAQAKPARRAPSAWIAAPGALIVIAAAVGAYLALRPHPARAPSRPTGPVASGAAPSAPGQMRRSFVLAGPSDLNGALTSAGLGPANATAAANAALGPLGSQPGELRVVLTLATAGSAPRLAALEVRKDDGTGVMVTPAAAGQFASKPLASDIRVQIRDVRGEMDANSFYTSAVAAGITDSLISPFAQAFAFDFDFQREIKPGDVFEAVFQHRVNGAGEPVGGDQLLYAALQTQQKSVALYRFQPPGEAQPGWFDGNGRSIVRSLMRTPVEGARITSTFGMRFHPILGYSRMHKGIDFAVPVGTPVYASGDGVVDFAGPHDGHGNYMKVRHSQTLETAYAHLSAFKVPVGTAVQQGQQIALSGNSGLSTGPHLHYEVIVNGEQVDPMTFQTTSGLVLQGAQLAAFKKARDRIDALRAAQNR